MTRGIAAVVGLLLVLAGLATMVPAAQAADDWGGLGFKIAPHTVTPTEEFNTGPTTSGPFVYHNCIYSVLVSIAKKDASKPWGSAESTSNNRLYSGLYERRSVPDRNFGIYMRENSSETVYQGNYFDYNTGQIDDRHTDYGDRVVGIGWRDYAGYQIHRDASGAYADSEREEFEKECAEIKVKWQEAQQTWAAGSTQFLRSPRFDASCTVSQSGPGGSQLSFGSVADIEDVGYTQSWTFSDGTTSTANGVSRTAAVPGPFSGTFSVDSSRGTLSQTCTAEVKAPELGVGVDIVDDAGVPIPIDAPPGVGDLIHVRVRITAGSDGVGALSGLAPVDEWLTSNGPVERVGEPELPGPFELQPGEKRDVVFDYRLNEAGTIGFGSAFQGTDAISRLVQADGGTRDTVAGIGVEVTTSWPTPPPKDGVVPPPAQFQADNNGDRVVDDKDHVLTVTVKATNLLDVPLTDVHAKDPEEAVDFVNNLHGGGAAAIELIPGETYDTKYGNLEAGASATKTYRYQATEEIDADANVSLRGTTGDDRVVPGFGTADAKLSSHLALDVRMSRVIQPTSSGQVVRLQGSLHNLLKDETLPDGTVKKAEPLAVLVIPVTDGNAGGGFVSTLSGGRTPLDSDPVMVAPGETVDINAILATQRSAIASHAKVHYLVRAWLPPKTADQAGTEVDASRIDFAEDETSSADHDVILGVNPLEPDALEECETTQLNAIISCNLWVGLRDLATSSYEVVSGGLVTGAGAYRRVILWEADMLRQSVDAIQGDPAAQERLVQELRVQLNTFVAAGIMSRDALGDPALIDNVGNAFTGFMNQTQDVFARGDYETIVKYTAQAVGSNPDIAIAPLLKLRMMRSLRAAAIIDAEAASKVVEITRATNAKAAREAQEGILARVEESAAKGENVAQSGVFRGDEDITDLPQIYSGVGGAREVDVKNLAKISEANDALIAYRGRSPISQELIDDGLAYVKPQDVKAKTVNSIDTTYLGYRRSSLGKIELTAPPVDFGLTLPGNEAAFATAVDAHMQKLASTFPEIADNAEWASEVRARLIQRTKEYPKELANFSRYADDGIKLEFGYGKQGLPSSLDRGASEIRAARVTPGVTTDAFGVERQYFSLDMAGPGGGSFKAITGDIDIVAILNPDRTLLTDPIKRHKIYRELQELLGMQHGETFTYVDKEVQAKLLRDHVPNPDGTTRGKDVLYVAGPDGRLRTGFLQERLSTAVDELGDLYGNSSFHLVSGGPRELVTPIREGRAALIDSYDTTWRKLQQASILLTPGKVDQFVNGLSRDQIDLFFNRGGAPLRPDGHGGLETYTSSGARTTAAPSNARSRGASFASVAGPSVSATRSSIPEIDDVLSRATALGIDLGQPVATHGPGALGGSWTPISLTDALASGRPGRLDTAPITSLPSPSALAAVQVAVTTPEQLSMDPATPWFGAGDTVVLDPGGATEERASIAAFTAGGEVSFSAPLTRAHPAGTTMILTSAAATQLPTAPPAAATEMPAAPTTVSPDPPTAAARAGSVIIARAHSTIRGRVVIRLSVRSSRPPSGLVRVKLGHKTVAVGTVRDGHLTLRGKRLNPGQKRLAVRYLGSSEVAPSRTTTSLRVRTATGR